MATIRSILDQYNHPSEPYGWASQLSDRADASDYVIIQPSLGASVQARPPTSVVPNGRVVWRLFNKPGTAGGPSDVASLDIVYNISGTVWT